MSEIVQKQNEPPDTQILPPSEQPKNEDSVKNSRVSLTSQRISGRSVIDKSQLSLTYNNMKFQAPPEFRELLSEVTKTVLEEQPTNIPLFLARYFKELDNEKVFQRQKAKIQAEKEEQERLERQRIEDEKQAEIQRQLFLQKLEQDRLAKIEADRLAEENFRKSQEEREISDAASYISIEVTKQAVAVRQEQILREKHRLELENLEKLKSENLEEFDAKIRGVERQKGYLDECMDTIYNRQMKAHRESLIQHRIKAEDYRLRLIELEDFISKVSDIIEKLNAEKPKLEKERLVYVETIEALKGEKHDSMEVFNSRILDLEVGFKDELEKIYKFLT